MEAGLEKGQWLGLVGSGGGLGHLGIQFAKAMGLKVVGVDARDEGLELSRQTGADLVVDARKGVEEVVKEVKRVTGGQGCPATVNISDAKTAAALACAITMMHGTMVQIAQVCIYHLETCIDVKETSNGSLAGRSERSVPRAHFSRYSHQGFFALLKGAR